MSADDLSRRQFLSTAAATAAAAGIFAPNVVTASKTESQVVIGDGEFKYEVHHHWPQLPTEFNWQTTHNVAVDKAQNLYVIHEGRVNQPNHPSVFVFDPQGKFVRAFGDFLQGGGHGIDIREEDGTEYVYVCGYQQVKAFAKMTLTGEIVWLNHAPMKSGVYAETEASQPRKVWGRDRFLPTNFAFLPDGDFFLVDGYGSFYIHRFDKDGNWKATFGGPGDGEGKFATPHGIWLDQRGAEPRIVIADRAHHTLQFLTLDGTYLETVTGFGLPANLDTMGKLLLVPELHARVSILDENNKVVAQLGDDVARVTGKDGGAIRGDESKWLPGKFVHPHDACFDAEGNIFVAEWVGTGRITKLKKLS